MQPGGEMPHLVACKQVSQLLDATHKNREVPKFMRNEREGLQTQMIAAQRQRSAGLTDEEVKYSQN